MFLILGLSFLAFYRIANPLVLKNFICQTNPYYLYSYAIRPLKNFSYRSIQ